MQEDCIFCKIAKGETQTKLEKETENLVVFKDINPQASIHLLIVPKGHVKYMSELDEKIWNEIKDVAVGIARAKGLTGFRIVINQGDAAQISHLHVHFLGDVSVDRAV